MGVAILDAALAALLIVPDEAHGETGAPRPVGARTVAAVADEIARREFVHGALLARKGRRMLRSWRQCALRLKSCVMLASPPGRAMSTRIMPADIVRKRHRPNPTSASEVKVRAKAASTSA
jgi:hypothetical protein